MPVVVTGLRELSAAYAKLARDTRLGWRKAERDIAEPVQRDAEALAQARITRIGRRWFKMRIGVTRSVVYVAPVQRGVKRKGDQWRRRPNLADLLMDKAMEPALERNEAKVERAVEALLDKAIADFNH
jgi:hypothetical protein